MALVAGVGAVGGARVLIVDSIRHDVGVLRNSRAVVAGMIAGAIASVAEVPIVRTSAVVGNGSRVGLLRSIACCDVRFRR